MKKKYYLLFICLFFSILVIYLLCITNIDIFIPKYEDTIIEHENKFKANNFYNNIIFTLLNESDMQVTSLTELNEIASSEELISLISYFLDLNKGDAIRFIEKKILSKMVNTIITPYYDSKVIYFTSDSYTMIFTMDGKNIYYNKFLSGESCTQNNEKNPESIDLISDNINKIMNKIGIKQNIGFDITSLRKAYTSEYYELYGHVYFIEDKTHNIKVTYELDCDIIYVLQVGFGELGVL